MSVQQNDLSAFGLEDVTFFLQFAPRDKLEAELSVLAEEETDLRGRLKKVEMRHTALKTYLDSKPPEPGKKEPPPLPTVTESEPEGDKQSLPTHTPTAQNTPIGGEATHDGVDKTDNGHEVKPDEITEKVNRTRKDRGTLEARNAFLLKVTEEKDNWLYWTEYKEPLLATGWLDEDEDVKEVIRNFLRQAGTLLAQKTVFSITSTNKVATARVFGLHKFQEPEQQDKYHQKLAAKVPELGLYMTEEEGIRARNAKTHGGQIEISSP